MRLKVTLVLLLANIALFASIFFFELGGRAGKEAEETRLRVFGPEAANLRTLTISAADSSLKLARDGETWSLTEPLKWPANTFAVSRILNELQFLEHHTQFTVADIERTGQSLADYGLAEPRLTLAFTSDGSPEPVTVQLGQDTAVGNRLYLLVVNTGRIHVVGRSLADSLSLSLASLRADTVFTIPVFEVRSATLQAGDGARVRLRRDQNRWLLEAPIITRASKTRVELALNDLNALRVSGFLPGDDPETAAMREDLSRPAFRLTLEGNNRRESLLVGPALATSPDGLSRHIVQLEGRDQLFAVDLPASLRETLANAQTTLRDRRVLDFDPARVTALTLASPAQPGLGELTLQRLDTGAWKIISRDTEGPGSQPADPKIVENLLTRLALLEAIHIPKTETSPEITGFESDAPSDAQIENFGLKLPQRIITLTLAPDPAAPLDIVTRRLELGLPDSGNPVVYARVAGQTFVYRVPGDILGATPVSARVYRERLLRNLTAGTRIASLSLRSADGKNTVYSHTLAENETWDQAFADESLERRQALATLIAQLRELRAETIVDETFPDTVTVNGEQRPWAWRLDDTVIEAGGEGSPEPHSLFIAERGGGGVQLIGSPRLNLVFNAPQPLIDALWTLLYGPRDPGPPDDPGSSAGNDVPAAAIVTP